MGFSWSSERPTSSSFSRRSYYARSACCPHVTPAGRTHANVRVAVGMGGIIIRHFRLLSWLARGGNSDGDGGVGGVEYGDD